MNEIGLNDKSPDPAQRESDNELEKQVQEAHEVVDDLFFSAKVAETAIATLENDGILLDGPCLTQSEKTTETVFIEDEGETIIEEPDTKSNETLLDAQKNNPIKIITKIAPTSQWGKKQKEKALQETQNGNIGIGAEIVIEIDRRDKLFESIEKVEQLPAPNPYFKYARAILLDQAKKDNLPGEAFEEYKNLIVQSQRNDPEFKTPESRKIKSRIGGLEKNLLITLGAEKIATKLQALDVGDTLTLANDSALEVRRKERNLVTVAVVSGLHVDEICRRLQTLDVDDKLVLANDSVLDIREKVGNTITATFVSGKKTSCEIKIPTNLGNEKSEKIRTQIEQLDKELLRAKKAELLCEQLKNLKIGNLIVSKNNQRKVLTINGDAITVLYKGETKAMSISEIIEWSLPAIARIISVEEKAVTDFDKTQVLEPAEGEK